MGGKVSEEAISQYYIQILILTIYIIIYKHTTCVQPFNLKLVL